MKSSNPKRYRSNRGAVSNLVYVYIQEVTTTTTDAPVTRSIALVTTHILSGQQSRLDMVMVIQLPKIILILMYISPPVKCRSWSITSSNLAGVVVL